MSEQASAIGPNDAGGNYLDEREHIDYLPDEYYAEATIIGRRAAVKLDQRRTHLNNNGITFGSPGSGKSRNIVGPNIMQGDHSLVIVDPKGALYREYAAGLMRMGYRVMRLDFKNPERSTCTWNPFQVARTDVELNRLCHTFATVDGLSKDPIWDQTAAQLMVVCAEASREMYGSVSLGNIMRVANKLREPGRLPEGRDASSFPHYFSALHEHFYGKTTPAAQQFFRLEACAESTWRSIEISLTSSLDRWNIPELLKMMSNSLRLIDLKSIGTQKTALFVVVPDTDTTFDALVRVFIDQCVSELCALADDRDDGRLPVPARFILDDFPTLGCFESLTKYVNSLRSREISLMMICQSLSQLADVYGARGAEGLIAACDTCAFVGGQNDPDTAEYIAKRIGVRGMAPTFNEAVWTFVRGCPPHLGPLYEPEMHPNYPVFAGGSKPRPFELIHEEGDPVTAYWENHNVPESEWKGEASYGRPPRSTPLGGRTALMLCSVC